ncbi:GntR family transcriptional regulator [Paenibacillus shirakamiensis]|uniref:GntR family transcriptional regulator n=1 Tax=Paenibacillus shirakamiensis TaxID=1265935 RepID=A0ABS4JFZ7_9BACL|nr:GntR family transcriptional regulator [Paenibacillus shirakamiensis]MBP2000630.1 GntR family transcriptional regulator [Paenibacillus shirakamiensis]
MDLLQSHAPLYYQLKHYIKDKINRQEWLVGTAIPSERQLEKAFSLSRTPVRQALGELVHEGILERRHGKGTFVAERKITQTTTSLIGLLENLQRKQLQPIVKVHDHRITAAPQVVTESLHLLAETPMIRVQRQILVEEICVIFDENYFHVNLEDYMTIENLKHHTVFELLEKNGIEIQKGSQRYSATLLNPSIAELMDLPIGSPALLVSTLLFNTRGIPLQYSISYCHPEHYEHEILLSR